MVGFNFGGGSSGGGGGGGLTQQQLNAALAPYALTADLPPAPDLSSYATTASVSDVLRARDNTIQAAARATVTFNFLPTGNSQPLVFHAVETGPEGNDKTVQLERTSQVSVPTVAVTGDAVTIQIPQSYNTLSNYTLAVGINGALRDAGIELMEDIAQAWSAPIGADGINEGENQFHSGADAEILTLEDSVGKQMQYAAPGMLTPSPSSVLRTLISAVNTTVDISTANTFALLSPSLVVPRDAVNLCFSLGYQTWLPPNPDTPRYIAGGLHKIIVGNFFALPTVTTGTGVGETNAILYPDTFHTGSDFRIGRTSSDELLVASSGVSTIRIEVVDFKVWRED